MKASRLHLIRESDNLTGFSKSSWLDEANRHLQSAVLLRSIRKRRRGKVKRETGAQKQLKHIKTMDACVLSSNLLVGYAVELALKAGLTAVYAGCSGRLFEQEVKRLYGHDFIKLAEEIEFPTTSAVREQLEELRRIVLTDGRYPPFARTKEENVNLYNERAALLWSDKGFSKRVRLCNAVISHVKRIDADSANTVTWIARRIDDEGYFAFRCGGNLKPRITVRYSTVQRGLRQNNKSALRRLLVGTFLPIRLYWTRAIYRCVKT